MDIDKQQQQQDDETFLATLSSQAGSNAHLQSSIAQFGELSRRKLWHQLTLSLMAFLRNSSETGHMQIQLWDGFIDRYKKRMDQLRVVEMATLVSQQYGGESA